MISDSDQLPPCTCEKAPEFFPNDWLTLRRLIVKGLEQVCNRDEFLLRNGASERAIAHRLGVYLEEILPQWTVDCEYNRIGNTTNTKIQPREELCERLEELAKFHGLMDHLSEARNELKCQKVEAGDKDINRRAFPDLIVHRRGCELHNLVIIELKTTGTARWKTLVDLAKLYSFTKEVPRMIYKKAYCYPRYRFGLFLEFAEKEITSGLLFRDGTPTVLDRKLEPITDISI